MYLIFCEFLHLCGGTKDTGVMVHIALRHFFTQFRPKSSLVIIEDLRVTRV